MSILIKGMKMPKAGDWKTIRVYYDGTCAEPNWQSGCKVMKGCEAVHISDHGDLIDRDAWKKSLIDECETVGIDGFSIDGLSADDVCYSIENAPIVIPAERSKG